MTKYFIGAIGSLLGIVAGAWLMLAPTALAYQPDGAGWVDATKVDFWSGIGLILLSVVGLVMFILALAAELKSRGIIESKEEQGPQEEEPEAAEEPASQQTDVEQVLLPLVNAMLKDMQDQQQRREGESSSQNNGSGSLQEDPERSSR